MQVTDDLFDEIAQEVMDEDEQRLLEGMFVPVILCCGMQMIVDYHQGLFIRHMRLHIVLILFVTSQFLNHLTEGVNLFGFISCRGFFFLYAK